MFLSKMHLSSRKSTLVLQMYYLKYDKLVGKSSVVNKYMACGLAAISGTRLVLIGPSPSPGAQHVLKGFIEIHFLMQRNFVVGYVSRTGSHVLKAMMTSSNGSIFHVTGPFEGNPPVTGGFPSQRPVTRSFDGFFGLRLNKRLGKQSTRRWLRRHGTHYDVTVMKTTALASQEISRSDAGAATALGVSANQ